MKGILPVALIAIATAILAELAWLALHDPGFTSKMQISLSGSVIAALVGLLTGFIGGVIALQVGIGWRKRSQGLEERITKLENWRQSQDIRQMAAAEMRLAPPTRRPPDFVKSDDFHRYVSSPRPLVAEAIPSPLAPEAKLTPISLEEIASRYRKVASGHISRSAFQAFFDTIGRSGPVEIVDDHSICASTNKQSFLTSVNTGESILVFPSYEFIANQDTQFSTIASVPESVAVLFKLLRGNGEITVHLPAVFVDANGPRLVSKGEIRGYGG